LIDSISADVRRSLGARLSPRQLSLIENTQFDRIDSGHLERCFLLRDTAKLVTGGMRESNTKVEALFDWVVRNIQLTGPDNSVPIPLSPQLALLIGRGNEMERAWLFMEMLRQLEIETVMLGYLDKDPESNLTIHVPWLPAVLIDDSLYLFDTTLGLPVPGSNGQGVATLQQVLDDPDLLAELQVDEKQTYRVGPEQLKKLIVLLESTPTYWAPRMRFLQDRLSANSQAVLWSDLTDLSLRIRKATGDGIEQDLWLLPKTVEEVSHQKEYWEQLMGSREQPLGLMTAYQFLTGIDARVAHMQGRWTDAIPLYMGNRIAFFEWLAVQRNQDGFKAIAFHASAPEAPQPDVVATIASKMQEIYESLREDCTYFLSVAKFEQCEHEPAISWASNYLAKYPNGKWTAGARFHLARCAEAQKDVAKAIEYYTADRDSPQAIGNMIRARRLGWKPDTAENTSDVKTIPLSGQTDSSTSKP